MLRQLELVLHRRRDDPFRHEFTATLNDFYINSLAVNDHNLLEFEDHVVIGDDVHLSGHTVERGFVKTASVRLGRNCTIGLGSVVGIGVTAGPGCQVGALSLVPKYAQLDANTTYVGTPVRKLERRKL